jgi:hypothetical protein
MNRGHPSPGSRRGVILTEAVASLALVGLTLAMVSVLLTQHARATDYFLNYRRAQLAAESCVERMRVGVLEATNAVFRDEAGVTCRIRIDEADDNWKPLVRVEVTTEIAGRGGRTARYSVATYLAPPSTATGGGP